jgi:hypothetical protein
VTVVLAMAAALWFGVNAWAQGGNAGEAGKGKSPHKSPEEIFQAMDANSDGAVTQDEFIAFHEARAKTAGRPAPAKEMMEKHFAGLDTNNDGKLTKEEFLAGWSKMRAGHGKHGAGHGQKPADQGAQQ